jgi:chromosome segregation ATPase
MPWYGWAIIGGVASIVTVVSIIGGAIYRKLGTIDTGMADARRAHETAQATAEGRFTSIDQRQGRMEVLVTDINRKAEKLDDEFSDLKQVVSRIEGLVIDPMQRFHTLEKSVADYGKQIATLETRLADLATAHERQIAAQDKEIEILRKWRHDLEQPRQVAVLKAAVEEAKKTLATDI